jgi:hypothetical protein
MQLFINGETNYTNLRTHLDEINLRSFTLILSSATATNFLHQTHLKTPKLVLMRKGMDS